MNYPTLICTFMVKHSVLQEYAHHCIPIGEVNSGDPAQTCSPVVVTPECVDDTCLGMLSRFLVDVVIQRDHPFSLNILTVWFINHHILPAGHESLLDVKTHLLTITEWLNLGLALGLHQPTLEKIRINQHNHVDSCMTDMIMDWLNQKDSVGTPSWQSLVRALMHPLVNKTDIAAHIAATYPKK